MISGLFIFDDGSLPLGLVRLTVCSFTGDWVLPDDLEALFSFVLEDLFFPSKFILPGNLDTNRFTKARDVLFSERFTLNPESVSAI
jgi:hypothetical protein